MTPEAEDAPPLKPLVLDDVAVEAGTIVNQLYKREDARTALDSLIQQWDKQVEKRGQYGLAYAYYRRGAKDYRTDKASALGWYKMGLTEYLSGDSLVADKIVRLCFNIANLYNEMNPPNAGDSILQYVNQGLDFINAYPAFNSEEKEFLKLYRMGGIGGQLNEDITTSLNYLEKGSDLAKQSPMEQNAVFKGRLESEYGWTLTMDQQYEAAEIHLNKALAFFALVDRPHYVADVQRYQATLYAKSKAFDRMEKAATAALAFTSQAQRGRETEGADLNNLGSALIQQGRLQEGRRYLEQALVVYEALGDEKMKGHTYENFALAAAQQNDFEQALRYSQMAEAVYHGHPKTPGLPYSLYREEMIDATIDRSSYGIDLHQQNPTAFPLTDIQLAAARVDSLLGLLRYAVRSEYSKRLLVAQLRPFHEKLIDFAHTQYQATGNKAYQTLGLQYLARSKAQILNERRARNRQGLSVEELEQLSALDQDIRQLKDAFLGSERQDANLLNQLHAQQLARQQLLEASFTRTQVDYTGFNDTPPTTQLADYLKPNELALEYFIGERTAFVGVYTPQGSRLKKLSATTQQLTEWIEAVTQFLRAPSDPRYQNEAPFRDSIEANYVHSSQQLYRVLVAEVLEQEPAFGKEGRSLTILPDGLLHRLPFATLLTEEVANVGDYTKYPFLLHEVAINYEFSVQAWLERLQTKRTFPTKNLVVAPVQERAVELQPAGTAVRYFLPALAANAQENDQISQLISARQLRKTGANRAKFLRIANNYKIIHFAGHGVLNTTDPYASFLVFNSEADRTTEEDLLYLDQLERLQLQADLLVLSACQTAEGELATGEGVISLGRAGALAGAGSVIAANWPVNQAAKAAFFQLFYTQLSEGTSRTEAIRQAKQTLLASDPRYAHPYYWSAFVNVGDGRPVG